MDSKILKELAYDIAKARILIQQGDVDGAQGLLDCACGLIPDEYYPTEAELDANNDPA